MRNHIFEYEIQITSLSHKKYQFTTIMKFTVSNFYASHGREILIHISFLWNVPYYLGSVQVEN